MKGSWKNWLILVLGIWVAVSPYVVDSVAIDGALSNLFSGVIIAIIGLWNLFGSQKTNSI